MLDNVADEDNANTLAQEDAAEMASEQAADAVDALTEDEPVALAVPVSGSASLNVDFDSGFIDWLNGSIVPFLNLMDIASISERRSQLLALEAGKNEDNIVDILATADAYLFLLKKYQANLASIDADLIDYISFYTQKSKAFKEWLGL